MKTRRFNKKFTRFMRNLKPAMSGIFALWFTVFSLLVHIPVTQSVFSATAEIPGHSVTAGFWVSDEDVVINEFLPNPEGDDNQTGLNGEWVELYNRTDDNIDVENWYIKDSQGNIVTITSPNTMSGDTIVPGNGWLVVYMNGEILDNDSDTVILFNNNDVQVDSYSYDIPDYNINNTPGWTNNLIAYLPLDSDTSDKSGNGNDGTNSGAVFSTGRINGGLSFDGNDSVTINNSDSLKPNVVTLEAWVKNAGSPGANRYISGKHYNSGWASYAIYTGSAGGIRFYIGYAGGYVLSPSASVVSVWDGGWHHIVGVFDGSNVRLYVDGLQVGSGTPTAQTIACNNDNFYIGSHASGYYFNGMIDEVKVYARALENSEIQDHYSAVTLSGGVPENKSYARIPDGSSNWVDPVPTPGMPNVLEEEAENIFEPSEIYYFVAIETLETDNPQAETEDVLEIQNGETEELEEESVSVEESVTAEETEMTEETTIIEEEVEPAEDPVLEEGGAVGENNEETEDAENVPADEPETDENPANNNEDVILSQEDAQDAVEMAEGDNGDGGDSGGESDASSAPTESSDSSSADSGADE